MANNKIVELENRQTHINQLKAARHIYTKAGRYSVWYMFLCVFIPVGISIGRFFVSTDAHFFINTLAAYSVFALIMGFILDSKASKCRSQAARIQQLFDIEVFELEWNFHLWGTKPSLENISDNIGDLSDDSFHNWYDSQIDALSRMDAIFICQRTNLVYDTKLRKRFNYIVSTVAIVVLLLILSVSFYRNEGIQTAIVFIGVPLVPIIKWFFSTRKQNLDDIELCESLKSFIDNNLEKLKKNHRLINESALYLIQDRIYIHRKTAFKIPDFLYNIMRKDQEESVRMMVNQLSHKKENIS